MMEDGKEEENDDNYHHMFLEYGGTTMEDHCAVLTAQLGTPRGRYDEHSSKFPSV
jgi:hypothetical protein